MSRLLPMSAAVLLLCSASLAQETPGVSGGAGQPQEATTPEGATAPAQAAMPEQDYKKVKDDDRMIDAWNLKVEDVEDMDVDGPDGKELGEVEKVLEDANGDIRAVVVEYGGFLGFGAKQVIVELDQLQPGKGRRFTTTLTEEQLSELPAWTK